MKDAMAACSRVGLPAPGMRSPVLLGFTDADLKVRDIMTDNVICAIPRETVLSAVKRMSQCRVSCVLVVEGATVVGILTERDVLRGVAAGGRDPTTLKVAERMSRPVVSVAPDASVPEAGAIMRSKSIKRLAVVEGEQLLGLVTQTDITRALVSLWPYKEVGEIMSAEVVTADASATVAEAAGLMSARNISCVVVMRQRDAVGIMTEKDVLKRVVALHRDAGTTLVAEVMSHPIVTLAPSHSIMCVSRMMDRMRIHRLVVMENKQVHGVVSQTDILDAVRAALEQIREAQLRRQSEVSQLTEATAQNLSSIENLVREALGIPALASEPATRTGTCEPAWCGSPTSVSHGHYPDTAANPMLTALQDLIAESRNNLARMSRILQMQVPAGGHLDGARRFAPIPPQPPEATRLTEARFEPCPAGTDPGRAES